MTGEKLSSIKIANMALIYWPVRLSNAMGGDGMEGGKRYFSPLRLRITLKSGIKSM